MNAIKIPIFKQNDVLCICYGVISYHTSKMDSFNLNIFAELSSLGEGNFSFVSTHTAPDPLFFFTPVD